MSRATDTSEKADQIYPPLLLAVCVCVCVSVYVLLHAYAQKKYIDVCFMCKHMVYFVLRLALLGFEAD